MISLHPTWTEIGLRLILTGIAGAVVGFNRGEHSQAAGLRTTILIALAASVAMIQANLLLPVSGKEVGSFGVMDLMRLPLGILTGVGFIGGGAILRRGDLVTGVTTAATLWVMTVIGLCFGGGQIGLGMAATGLAVVTLWMLKWFDLRIPREHHALLVIQADRATFSAGHLRHLISPLGCAARFRCQVQGEDANQARFSFEICWKRSEVTGPPLDLPELVGTHYIVLSFEIMS